MLPSMERLPSAVMGREWQDVWKDKNNPGPQQILYQKLLED